MSDIFGDPGGEGKLGPFSGHAYGDFYGGEPNKTAWLTAEIDEEIVVPQTRLDFDLGKFAGKGLASQTNYQTALQANSLAGYLQAVENQKDNPSKVAPVQPMPILSQPAFNPPTLLLPSSLATPPPDPSQQRQRLKISMIRPGRFLHWRIPAAMTKASNSHEFS